MGDRVAGYGAEVYELDNGVRVVIKPRPRVPLASMAVCWRGGVAHEGPERAGTTSLMARGSLKGTQNRTAAQLAEESELLGGVISPSVSSDLLRWTITAPSRHFEAAFALLAETALRPAFPAEEIHKERRIMLSDLERLSDDMRRYPFRLFLQGAYPGHPYGRSTAETEAAVRSTGPEELTDWHRDQVLAGSPWVFFVGDVDPEQAMRLAAREFSGFDSRPAAANGPEPPGWPAEACERYERREKAQTALALGFPGPARQDADLYAFELLSNILSGLGGRLFDELRERRSLAYTVSAYPVTRRLAGTFTAYIATSPEKEDEARRGLLEQFERLVDEPVSREEIERARRYIVGAWQIRSQTNGAQLLDMMDALLLGRGLAELDAFEERIREVTPEAIREAMRRRFDPARLVQGVVRGSPSQ